MIATLLTIAVIILLLFASQWWWKSLLNPMTIGILAWSPGLIMLNWQPYFLSAFYIHLNRPVSLLLYYALALAFCSFWAGCATVKAMSRPAAFQIDAARLRLEISTPRAWIFFLIGLAVFVYVYVNSGLLGLEDLDIQGVAESRLRLHIGPISFLILFMDVAGIAMFVLFLQRRGGILYLLPIMIAMMCQAATLQKSRFVFLVLACICMAALHPKDTYAIFLRSTGRRAIVASAAIAVFVALFAMNSARGVGTIQMTASSSPIVEQIYIYSGAAAMQNVSVTLEGYIPSDAPAMGAYLARPILWEFVDRDTFFVARYFGGINASTYLIYAWADFRWLGFIITPFLLGVLVMIFLRISLGGSVIGFVLGVIALQVLVLSPNTDVMFDPTTLLFIVIAIGAQIFTYPFDKAPRRHAMPYRPPPDRRHAEAGIGTVGVRPSRPGPSRP